MTFGILRRPRVAAVVLLASIVIVVASAMLIRTGPHEPPTPTPTPVVVASAGDLETVPEAPEATTQAIAGELEEFFSDVFERLFLPPLPAPTPAPDAPASPEPTPVPRPAPTERFSPDAWTAAEAASAAFSARRDEVVTGGSVSFTGVLTVDGERGTSALLEVELAARGFQEAGDDNEERRLRLRQTGQWLLRHTDGGWIVTGFEVELEVEREVPTPDAPEALRSASGRWGL